MFQFIRRISYVMMCATLALGLVTERSFAAEGGSAVDSENIVMFTTNKGVIKIKLNAEKAPITVANFKKYVDEKFFDGTIFHRVIKDFMIQGGGFEANLSQKKTHDPIQIESNNGLKNNRGTVAMARTSDPNSATAQFFINLKDNNFLNYTSPTQQGYGYAVFGEVIEGMDVVDAIAAVQTGNKGGYQDVPVETVLIESATTPVVMAQ
jgi:peptidyl-prolyl cis-trans isomerase B (cyclophilin B)